MYQCLKNERNKRIKEICMTFVRFSIAYPQSRRFNIVQKRLKKKHGH